MRFWRVVSLTDGPGCAVAALSACRGRLMVSTVPPPRLSSIVRTPCKKASDSRAIGRPDPTPRMYWRCSGVAVVKPGCTALPLSWMPGP